MADQQVEFHDLMRMTLNVFDDRELALIDSDGTDFEKWPLRARHSIDRIVRKRGGFSDWFTAAKFFAGVKRDSDDPMFPGGFAWFRTTVWVPENAPTGAAHGQA